MSILHSQILQGAHLITWRISGAYQAPVRLKGGIGGLTAEWEMTHLALNPTSTRRCIVLQHAGVGMSAAPCYRALSSCLPYGNCSVSI